MALNFDEGRESLEKDTTVFRTECFPSDRTHEIETLIVVEGPLTSRPRTEWTATKV